MNQPNLQAIMDNITVELHFQAGKVTQEYIGTKTAIDAIYAGLLAEVIGGGYPISAISSANNAMQNTTELQAMEKLREAQTEALKRWCYGDENDKL